jgi:putative two-component system response regulator
MMVEPAQTRVLVVDDEPYVREILRRWLEEEGYRCAQAANAEEALEALRADDYHLLISDIRMPGLSGLELLVRIRAQLPDVAVIMVTAVDDRSTAVTALELGAYGYVIKPFGRNEVLINIANALERRRLDLAGRDYQQLLEEEVRQRTAEIQRREEEISLRLISAAAFRNEETGSHIRRMGLYAELLASALTWRREEIEAIRLAAPMHDVGKIGIPDTILLKPGELTTREFQIIKTHTQIGAHILEGSRIPLLGLAKEIALSHHEKWDGSGYPRGLKGDAIPASGRLVAVVDVYDALVHDRVYRPALSESEAVDIMRDGRGSHLDPRFLDTFLDLLPEIRRIQEQVADEAGDRHL